jgi:hypothetical protein
MERRDTAEKEARRIVRRRRDEWARRPASAGAMPTARQTERSLPDPPLLGGTHWSVDVAAIERERMLRGWSRLQLAATARVSPKTLRDLLGQRRRPTLGTVQAVGVAVGLTLADLIKFPPPGGG